MAQFVIGNPQAALGGEEGGVGAGLVILQAVEGIQVPVVWILDLYLVFGRLFALVIVDLGDPGTLFVPFSVIVLFLV